MRKSMYTILDQKAQFIGPVFLAVSDSEAQRSVALGVRGNDVIMRYPADFVLLRLADIDCHTGEVTAPDMPCTVCKLDELELRPKGFSIDDGE